MLVSCKWYEEMERISGLKFSDIFILKKFMNMTWMFIPISVDEMQYRHRHSHNKINGYYHVEMRD